MTEHNVGDSENCINEYPEHVAKRVIQLLKKVANNARVPDYAITARELLAEMTITEGRSMFAKKCPAEHFIDWPIESRLPCTLTGRHDKHRDTTSREWLTQTAVVERVLRIIDEEIALESEASRNESAWGAWGALSNLRHRIALTNFAPDCLDARRAALDAYSEVRAEREKVGNFRNGDHQKALMAAVDAVNALPRRIG